MLSQFRNTEQIYASMDYTELDKTLRKAGRIMNFDNGTGLQPRKDEVLVILSGQMIVSDCSNEGLALGHTFQFFPVGLIERYYQLPLFYHAGSPTTASQLTSQEFDSIFFHNPKYAELLCRIMTYLSSTLIHIYYERNNASGYATIREMLRRYMYKVENGNVCNEGIAAFILKRTRLSRSYVFQILAALKEGNYITVQNGKLKSINRDIPEKF